MSASSPVIVLLAAGEASRFGSLKQLAMIEGEPMVRRASRQALACGVPVLAVLGAGAERVASALADLPLQTVVHEGWRDGLGSSLAAGVRAVQQAHPQASGALVMLADQPRLGTALLAYLLALHAQSPAQIIANKKSLTGKYLSGAENIPVPAQRRKPANNRWLKVVGARGNNLKNVTANIPLGTLTCITGVSGGGKSTLTIETLYKAAARKLSGAREHPAPHDRIEGLEYLDKVIDIDQSPIGRTPRSNPATYTGAFTPIRDWFTELPEAKARGYQPGRFSFNVKGGRCEACQGDGVIQIEMHFLPDVYVQCDVCKGKRYNRETLEVKFRDHSIADVLDMTIEAGAELFKAVPSIHEKLETLKRVGLGYIAIGQQATTLSGGEAQRVKLSKELSRRATGRTLYILDEPTTGLHFHDVKKLLEVLQELVDAGNTVVVIEHNLEVIKTADWIIDLGPEGGDGGGEIVASGTPEDVVKVARSYTGQYLKPLLKPAAAPKKRQAAE